MPLSFKHLNLFISLLFLTFSAFSQNSNSESYSKNPEAILKGKELFEQNCGSCHNFKQKGIGPNLAQITSEMSKDWINKFIRNPQGQIKKGDKRATELFKEYKVIMPAFPFLTKSNMEALLGYMNSEKKVIKKRKEINNDAIKDPISKNIKKSGLKLKLNLFTTAPATSEKSPKARINSMVPLKGASISRLFLSDLRGLIYEMDGETLHTFFDFKDLNRNFIESPGLGTGLGSYAFHPEFYENGLLYTTHTEKIGLAKADFYYSDSIKVALQWIITEWKVKNPASKVFEAVSREILRINMVSQIHGMQEIAFNPYAEKGQEDFGLLYIGIGDGGASENGFPEICADSTTPWGSVLRIDPLGRNSKNGKYGIPPTNPFKNQNAIAEVYCRGFRNPNRIYWTPEGKMLISDIGHKNIEELNFGIKGADFGWPLREGTFVINPIENMDVVYPIKTIENQRKYQDPILQYDHDEGNAISAGFVYNENSIPNLKGKYIFGDIVNGRVFYAESKDFQVGKQAEIVEFEMELNGKLVNFKDLVQNPKADLRFGQGLDGEIYLYTKTDGKMYKIVGCE